MLFDVRPLFGILGYISEAVGTIFSNIFGAFPKMDILSIRLMAYNH